MVKSILKQYSFLQDLDFIEFVFQPDIHGSLAAAIVNANLPYRPGVYLVYNYTENQLGNLLYVGIAGADKNGNINTHQLPKRLLAVTYPPDKYLTKMPSRHTSRNDAWPIMMEMDGIQTIKIYCFFSPIQTDFKVNESKLPIDLERSINKILKEKNINQPWSKRHS